MQKPEKGKIAATDSTDAEKQPRKSVGHISLICPFCKGSLSGAKVVRCSVCDTKHHATCWGEHGRCSVFECPGKEELVTLSKRQIRAVAGIAGITLFAAGTGLWFFWTTREGSEVRPAAVVRKTVPSGMTNTTGPAACDQGNLSAGQRKQVKEMLEAAKYGQTDRILALIRSGVAPDSRAHVSVFHTDDRCWSPLITAAYYGNAGTVQALINSGVQVDGPDEYGYTALLMAVIGNHPEIVQILLKAGANVNAQNIFGDGALTPVVIRGNTEMVEILIRSRVNINSCNLQGYTAMIQSLRAKQFQITRVLLQAHADPNLADRSGRTSLSWACETADAATVAAILQSGAHVNTKDRRGTSPLMYATMAGNTVAIQKLIQAGADIHATDAQGQTALMYAKKTYRTDLIRLLEKSTSLKEIPNPKH